MDAANPQPRTYREAMSVVFGVVPDAAAVAIERTHMELGDEVTQLFGGGWRAAFDVWKGLEFPYLLLVAYCPERVESRNPLAMMAADLSRLEVIAQVACNHLVAVTCGWFQALDGQAKRVLNDVLLRDANAAGRA